VGYRVDVEITGMILRLVEDHLPVGAPFERSVVIVGDENTAIVKALQGGITRAQYNLIDSKLAEYDQFTTRLYWDHQKPECPIPRKRDLTRLRHRKGLIMANETAAAPSSAGVGSESTYIMDFKGIEILKVKDNKVMKFVTSEHLTYFNLSKEGVAALQDVIKAFEVGLHDIRAKYAQSGGSSS